MMKALTLLLAKNGEQGRHPCPISFCNHLLPYQSHEGQSPSVRQGGSFQTQSVDHFCFVSNRSGGSIMLGVSHVIVGLSAVLLLEASCSTIFL